jgi:hypothetical protein
VWSGASAKVQDRSFETTNGVAVRKIGRAEVNQSASGRACHGKGRRSCQKRLKGLVEIGFNRCWHSL